MTGQLFDFDEVSKNSINTLKLEISKAAWMCIEKENPGVVKIKLRSMKLKIVNAPMFEKGCECQQFSITS